MLNVKVFVTTTHSTNPDYNADCDFAVIRIDRDLARRILRRVRAFELMHATDKECLAQGSGDLKELVFWDSTPTFHKSSDELEALAELPQASFAAGCVEAPEGFEPGEPQRTECGQMMVDEGSVYWTVIPKHCDIYVETRPIGLAALREIACD